MEFVRNPSAESDPVSRVDQHMLGADGPGRVQAVLRYCPAYQPTPLLRLGALAKELGVGEIWIKDEGQRLRLGSFKALGGAYAVIRTVLDAAEKELGRAIEPAELTSESVRTIGTRITVACATDGNHGRSVAAGAAVCGCTSVVFLHEGVSGERAEAISRMGARIVRVPGRYDESVRVAKATAAASGWTLISDTSDDLTAATPRVVMQGYTVLFDEALGQLTKWGAAAPTHVLLQAGVGGLAAAGAVYLNQKLGKGRAKIVVVEPEQAACVLESVKRGVPTKVAVEGPTIMAMLEAFEPSHIAFQVLKRLAHAFVTVSDGAAIEAMRKLAFPTHADPAVVSGESGAAGMAALLLIARDREMRAALGIDASSSVLLVNTETATDIASYVRLVGCSPASIAGAGGHVSTDA